MRSQAGYYNVRIDAGGMTFTYTVYAISDEDAAERIGRTTGLAPQHLHNVDFITSSYIAAHAGYLN